MSHPPFSAPADDADWVALARELAADFATRAAAHDEAGDLPIENLEAMAAAGLDTALLPRSLGGADLSYRAFGEILGAVTRACPSTGCIWLMHVGAALTLTSLGDPAMAELFAGELAAGKRFANALSEPTSGNLFLMPLQHAVATEGGWTLSGAKRFVSGCEIADHLLVNALVENVPSFFGVARDPSITFVPIWDTMGMRVTRSQLISFDGTLLRADRRCHAPDPTTPNPIGTGLAWMSIGVAEAALAALIEHATNRVIPTTGQPPSHLQWVQFAVADAHVQLEAARLMAGKTMWLADARSPGTLDAALAAKLYANDVARSIADLGVRIGGASGYLKTSPIQRHFRDAQAGALMAYSTELCRDYLGKAVLQVAPPSEGGFG